MHAFSYAWWLLVTWQRWRSDHSIRRSRTMVKANLMALSFIEQEHLRSKFYIAGMNKWGISTFLLLWPWPWPNDLRTRIWQVFPGNAPDVLIWSSTFCLRGRWNCEKGIRETASEERVLRKVEVVEER